MVEFLSTYSETWGMTPASVIASVFGAFAATFAVLICWPKLVKDFGAAGGILSAAFLIGTFWLLNHKLLLNLRLLHLFNLQHRSFVRGNRIWMKN